MDENERRIREALRVFRARDQEFHGGGEIAQEAGVEVSRAMEILEDLHARRVVERVMGAPLAKYVLRDDADE